MPGQDDPSHAAQSARGQSGHKLVFLSKGSVRLDTHSLVLEPPSKFVCAKVRIQNDFWYIAPRCVQAGIEIRSPPSVERKCGAFSFLVNALAVRRHSSLRSRKIPA
jgi:hypothetical protein